MESNTHHVIEKKCIKNQRKKTEKQKYRIKHRTKSTRKVVKNGGTYTSDSGLDTSDDESNFHITLEEDATTFEDATTLEKNALERSYFQNMLKTTTAIRKLGTYAKKIEQHLKICQNELEECKQGSLLSSIWKQGARISGKFQEKITVKNT